MAEVTLRTAAAADGIRRMAARRDFLVGAGTVLTAAQVDDAVAAGARFVVSPGSAATSSSRAVRTASRRCRAQRPPRRSWPRWTSVRRVVAMTLQVGIRGGEAVDHAAEPLDLEG